MEKSQRWRSRIKNAVLILLAILCYAAAFPPYEIAALAWFAPLFWLLLLTDSNGQWQRPGVRFWRMQITGYFSSAIVVYWLTHLFAEAAIALWIVPALWFGLWGLMAGAFGKFHWTLRVIWPAIAWVGLEYLRCELAPLAFSFGSLGSSQPNALGFTLASAIGVYGVSGFMVLLAGLILEVIRTKRRVSVAPFATAITLIVIAILAMVLGSKLDSDKKVLGHAALQQLAMNDDIGAWTETPERSSDEPPDLIVWPELTYANDPRLPECQWFVDLMKMDANKSRWGILFGAVRLPPESNSVNDRFYNTAYFMKPDGTIADYAVKNKPVQLMADGMPAEDVTVMNIGTDANGNALKAGVGICYDGCFQRYAQRMVSRGAQYLVFPTMNAEAWGPTQHSQHQRLFQMRAAENGRSVLVAAVSGPTFAALPSGQAGERAPFHTTTTVIAEIRAPEETWFSRGGCLLGPFCLTLTAIGAIAGVFLRFRKRRNLDLKPTA